MLTRMLLLIAPCCCCSRSLVASLVLMCTNLQREQILRHNRPLFCRTSKHPVSPFILCFLATATKHVTPLRVPRTPSTQSISDLPPFDVLIPRRAFDRLLERNAVASTSKMNNAVVVVIRYYYFQFRTVVTSTEQTGKPR